MVNDLLDGVREELENGILYADEMTEFHSEFAEELKEFSAQLDGDEPSEEAIEMFDEMFIPEWEDFLDTDDAEEAVDNLTYGMNLYGSDNFGRNAVGYIIKGIQHSNTSLDNLKAELRDYHAIIDNPGGLKNPEKIRVNRNIWNSFKSKWSTDPFELPEGPNVVNISRQYGTENFYDDIEAARKQLGLLEKLRLIDLRNKQNGNTSFRRDMIMAQHTTKFPVRKGLAKTEQMIGVLEDCMDDLNDNNTPHQIVQNTWTTKLENNLDKLGWDEVQEECHYWSPSDWNDKFSLRDFEDIDSNELLRDLPRDRKGNLWGTTGETDILLLNDESSLYIEVKPYPDMMKDSQKQQECFRDSMVEGGSIVVLGNYARKISPEYSSALTVQLPYQLSELTLNDVSSSRITEGIEDQNHYTNLAVDEV